MLLLMRLSSRSNSPSYNRDTLSGTLVAIMATPFLGAAESPTRRHPYRTFSGGKPKSDRLTFCLDSSLRAAKFAGGTPGRLAAASKKKDYLSTFRVIVMVLTGPGSRSSIRAPETDQDGRERVPLHPAKETRHEAGKD